MATACANGHASLIQESARTTTARDLPSCLTLTLSCGLFHKRTPCPGCVKLKERLSGFLSRPGQPVDHNIVNAVVCAHTTKPLSTASQGSCTQLGGNVHIECWPGFGADIDANASSGMRSCHGSSKKKQSILFVGTQIRDKGIKIISCVSLVSMP
jgi:hypothetical protein